MAESSLGWHRLSGESDGDEVHRDKVMSVLCQPVMAGIGLDCGDVLVGAGEAVRVDAASVIGGCIREGRAQDAAEAVTTFTRSID